jgi:hypothetical protein
MDDDERLARLERKINVIGELAIYAVAAGIGSAVGYSVQEYDKLIGWGWPASITAGLTVGVVAWALQSRFR